VDTNLDNSRATKKPFQKRKEMEARGEEPSTAGPAPAVPPAEQEDEQEQKVRGKNYLNGGEEDTNEIEAQEGTAQNGAATTAEKSEAEEGEDDDEEDDGNDDTAASKKKKKKRKKNSKRKKKGIWSLSDDEFDALCKRWLNETKHLEVSEERKKVPATEFNGYTFTGPLRPMHVTKTLGVKDEIKKPDYASHVDGYSLLELEKENKTDIPLLEGSDLMKMKEVCAIGREVLDTAGRFLRAGVTGDEVDRVVYGACMDRGVYPSPLGYFRFPKSVCVSPNEVICHGIPDCREIQDGDIVNLDVSVYLNGFHADLNETFLIGNVDEESVDLVKVSYECLQKASELIRPGTLYRELGSVISKHAAQNGCSVVRRYCGHGVGRLFHGNPSVPHYAKNKAIGIMQPGHVFTIEPMINRGSSWEDRTWPDKWTAVTLDGKRSAQFEHTFLVTETGFEILTARPGTTKDRMPDFIPQMFQR